MMQRDPPGLCQCEPTSLPPSLSAVSTPPRREPVLDRRSAARLNMPDMYTALSEARRGKAQERRFYNFETMQKPPVPLMVDAIHGGGSVHPHQVMPDLNGLNALRVRYTALSSSTVFCVPRRFQNTLCCSFLPDCSPAHSGGICEH